MFSNALDCFLKLTLLSNCIPVLLSHYGPQNFKVPAIFEELSACTHTELFTKCKEFSANYFRTPI